LSNHQKQDGGITHAGATVRDGMRAALPLLLPTLLIGVSFGVAARSLGWGV
jgi:predicted branched-subunit amino acid permease